MENESEAKLIRRERFSNKLYRIEVKLYEHGMATADIIKKRMRRRYPLSCHGGLCFDECRTESMYDLMELLPILDCCKVARRWFLRVMRHCTDGYMTPNGWVDYNKVRQDENERHHMSEMTTRLSIGQLKAMKECVPDVFKYGYRTNERRSFCLKTNPPVYRTFEPRVQSICERKRRRQPPYYKKDAETLLNLLKHVVGDFYEEIARERTLDDCDVEIRYHWWSGDYPHIRATVYDKHPLVYCLPWDWAKINSITTE